LNLLERSKDEPLQQLDYERLRDNRDRQWAGGRRRDNDSQIIKTAGTNSNLIGVPISSGLFGRLSEKGALGSNILAEQSQVCEPKQLISKQTFMYHYIIGKGGFGKVWRVESKKNRQYYAMKEMLKSL